MKPHNLTQIIGAIPKYPRNMSNRNAHRNRDELLKLAERAAAPDLSAHDQAEICAGIAALDLPGEPVISVLQQLDAERRRREEMEIEVNLSRFAKCRVDNFVEIVGNHFRDEYFRVAVDDGTRTSIDTGYSPTPSNHMEIYEFQRMNTSSNNIVKRIS